MRKPDLPYLEAKTVKGRQYLYFRRAGQYHRLPDNPDTEEFARAYWEIRSGKVRAPVKTSWEALILRYYGSAGFKRLAKGTQANYRRHCEAIREKNGAKDVRKFTRPQAMAVRDKLADNWSKANERMAVLRQLCGLAVDLEWLASNPVSDIKKLDGGQYEAWPDEALEAYEAAAAPGTVARTVYELALGTGQRLGDCIAMRWDDLDGEFVRVVQQKTGARLWVFCPARLRDYLGALDRRGAHILALDAKRPLGKRAVQKAVEDVREKIGARHGAGRLVPHGWRYTAARQLAEAGCSDAEIQAVTGHRTLQMVQKYRGQADGKRLSRLAQRRREQTGDTP
jgi:integrase